MRIDEPIALSVVFLLTLVLIAGISYGLFKKKLDNARNMRVLLYFIVIVDSICLFKIFNNMNHY